MTRESRLTKKTNGWALSRYYKNFLPKKVTAFPLTTPGATVMEVKTLEEMIFGIFEDTGGTIWFNAS